MPLLLPFLVPVLVCAAPQEPPMPKDKDITEVEGPSMNGTWSGNMPMVEGARFTATPGPCIVALEATTDLPAGQKLTVHWVDAAGKRKKDWSLIATATTKGITVTRKVVVPKDGLILLHLVIENPSRENAQGKYSLSVYPPE